MHAHVLCMWRFWRKEATLVWLRAKGKVGLLCFPSGFRKDWNFAPSFSPFHLFESFCNGFVVSWFGMLFELISCLQYVNLWFSGRMAILESNRWRRCEFWLDLRCSYSRIEEKERSCQPKRWNFTLCSEKILTFGSTLFCHGFGLIEPSMECVGDSGIRSSSHTVSSGTP